MSKPKFIMLVGLPGTGKSYYAKQLEEKGYFVHCSEEYGDVNDMSINNKVFRELQSRIRDDLKTGNSVIYDATNTKYKRRMGFLRELKSIDCEKICHWVYLPYEKCLENNEGRERSIPKEVIKQIYLNFNVPYYYEGWDDIQIIGETQSKLALNKIDSLCSYSQDNSHHKFTLGEHLLSTTWWVMENAMSREDKKLLSEAAYLHDIGKPFTKKFTNAKGVPSDEAHYYNHNFCGAYDSVDYEVFGCDDALTRAVIIMWHMQPNFWEKDQDEKQRLKYKKLWGDKLYEQIMIVHKADRAAH